jgi:hypothetical protein
MSAESPRPMARHAKPSAGILSDRMRLFGRSDPAVPASSAASEPSSYRTEIPPVDAALGGGLRRGAVTLIRSEGSASGRDFRRLTGPARVAALHHGLGALIVPTLDETPREVMEFLVTSAGSSTIMAKVRVLDYMSDRSTDPWLVPMGRRVGRDAAIKSMKAMVAAEIAVRGKPPRPTLELSAVDTMEHVTSPEVAARMMAHGLPRSRGVGNLAVTWIRGDSRILGDVQRFADVELVLRRGIEGLSIRGARPTFGPVSLTL